MEEWLVIPSDFLNLHSRILMKLSIEGYKSIATKREMNFDGLTILSGANSSGKSSFMQPFLILKQTIESHYSSDSLTLDGENIKLTDSSQVMSKIPTYKKKAFIISMKDDISTVEVEYRYKRNTGIIADKVTINNSKEFKNGFFLSWEMTSDQILNQLSASHFSNIEDFYKEEKIKAKWKVKRKKGFIYAELSPDTKKTPMLKMGIEPTQRLENLVARMIHVPGLRGNPERSYKLAATGQIYSGSFDKYVASIVAKWGSKSKKQDELIKQLEELGLANNISASKLNDTRVELMVSRYKKSSKKDNVNIADVGFGVSQVLPVLLALLCATKNQFVYIEQPELHLHPKAQFKLAKIITKAVMRGVKVIIETHSSLLIRGIQIDVVEKKLDYEKTSLNWFTQNPETGETDVTSVTLDKLGAFGDWPEDFDDISLSVEEKYLNAVEVVISA
jgi:predicted ATPase